ncbi:hypothetical protein BRADI_1g23691v3 [Brachypodium distachyon]|uniref:Uncharacterized protein n=1 Tax=Brachypodium distachyon TaxID=15368 RepID=A0A0Q3JC99_BRADI|nr:hypothetical protein BRADI_1g23691v3 [Brachypodium distachyon]
MAPMLVDDAFGTTFCLNSPLYILSTMLKLRYAGDRSGRIMSPSRYCMTCRMVGLALASGCEHSSPSFSTSETSSGLNPAGILGSTASKIKPLRHSSTTRSTSTIRLSRSYCSIGLRPQVISRRNAPKANTSVDGVALPVCPSSGAR